MTLPPESWNVYSLSTDNHNVAIYPKSNKWQRIFEGVGFLAIRLDFRDF